MSTQRTEDIHRGKGNVGDILSHIIPHIENMDPKQVRRSITETVINFFQKNEKQIHPQLSKATLRKLDVLLELSDPLLSEAATNFALWFDKLVAEYVGTTSPQVDLREPETYKTPHGILDVFHFDYGLKWVGMRMRSGKKGMDILIGELHKNVPFSLARGIASSQPQHVQIVLAEGDIRGPIKWICAERDEMSVKVEHLEDGYHVFESVWEALPWLKVEKMRG